MKKITISLFLFLFLIRSMVGQSITKPFYFSVSLASEPYDDRIYGFRKSAVDRIIKLNSENNYQHSTKYLKTEIGYSFILDSKFQFDFGVGFAKEWSFYYRPYDKCVILTPKFCTGNLVYLDKFNYSLMNLSINPKYQFFNFKDWKIITGVGFLPSVKLISNYHDKNTLKIRRLNKVGFFSMEINPNIGINFRQFEFNIFYRLWQIKKVDRVIHPKTTTLGHPVLEGDFEKRNPTKIGLTLKYRFNFNRKKVKK